MVSEASTTSSSDQEADIAVEKPVKRCSSSKSKPKKIAKKVHKSEREKLKRDQLNVLFLQLSKCLDSVHQNHGKASTLTETTKLVGDLISQIECLKKENTSLLSESQYLLIEKNELKEETGALKDEIVEVQNKIGEKIHSQSSSQLVEENIFVKLSQQSHLVVIPTSSLQQQQQVETYREECDVVAPSSSSNHVIRRPHARYPSPWDSWPSQILDNQTHTAEAMNISNDISKETVSLA
ncbi:transcription factor bHLH47-like [Impatiens glandulifera]|uniref:transcription factor bHLH47-like n=1 Tax=Impatiens glandulifera TaxID=253017 RepID=UPI001FB13CA3|nr:transcription factor bHLH47-like [Impatiens glandulifera]